VSNQLPWRLTTNISSPFSVQSTHKAKLAEDGKESTTQKRMVLENGHPGVEVNEAAILQGLNPYAKYYQQQGDSPAGVIGSNGQPAAMRLS
jgi:pre-mRNA-processing factor 39